MTPPNLDGWDLGYDAARAGCVYMLQNRPDDELHLMFLGFAAGLLSVIHHLAGDDRTRDDSFKAIARLIDVAPEQLGPTTPAEEETDAN